MKEEYRIIEEAPRYTVSNYGNIKSFVSKKNGYIMKSSYDKDGYKRIALCLEDGGRIYRRVHQLVAKAFIPNPNNYTMINHINGNREDNRVENLEWCDNSRNQFHSYRENHRVWNREPHRKDMTMIKATNIITQEYILFDSVNECARYYGVSDSAIFNRLRNRVRNPSNSPKSPMNGIYVEVVNSNDYPEKEQLLGENPNCEARDILKQDDDIV